LDLLQESTPDIIVITGDYWRFGSSKPGILSPIWCRIICREQYTHGC